ncbi:MAG: serine/threonine protein kinase, partial [bacterium]|nr:serine/threonine protein kinase [bacterium]
RDLKPANILVVGPQTKETDDATSHSCTVMDSLGQPKILDFGIARVTDADIQTVTIQTDVGQLVGTLAYMSPEQVAGNSDDIDTRSDIYTLGVILYQLVTGRLPHDISGRAIPEAARIIREDDPSTVSSLNVSLRGDVETIIAKAMEKDPERRYASASTLAADIRRHLSHEPIAARPASTFYQLGKFASRNKGLVGGLTATFVMLGVALIGTGYGLVQAGAQRDAANAANAQLQTVVRYQSAMLEELDVAEMGQGVVAHLRAEARSNLADNSEVAATELASFERVLS